MDRLGQLGSLGGPSVPASPMNSQTLTNKLEAAAASAGTVASMASGIADANQWLQFAITLATFAWWVRLWWKDPNVKPPGK